MGKQAYSRRARFGVASIVGGALLAVGPVAQAHHIENHIEQRRHIVNRARAVLGTPYRYGGTSTTGFDCSGFTSWVFSGHGAELPRTSMGQFQLGDQAGHRRIYKRENLRFGDLVFHKTTSATVGHVGIYVGRGNFISATSSSGVQTRSLYDPYYWGDRWVGGVRLPVTIAPRSDYAPPSSESRPDRHPKPERQPERKQERGERGPEGEGRATLFA